MDHIPWFISTMEASMGRNTQILEEIVNVLRLSHLSLEVLEEHFKQRLLVDAGDVDTIITHAQHLRLRVEKDECGAVLDYLASKGMVSITIDHVEEAINTVYGEDRFIEP
jgi:hypothetical protein